MCRGGLPSDYRRSEDIVRFIPFLMNKPVVACRMRERTTTVAVSVMSYICVLSEHRGAEYMLPKAVKESSQ